MSSLDVDDSNKKYNECIICFDNDDHNGSKPNDISTKPFVITKCNCKYKCHDDCIREWISKTSRCLLCNAAVFTLPSVDEETIIRGLNTIALSEPLLISEDEILVHNPPLPPYHTALENSYPVSNSRNMVISNPTGNGIVLQENITLVPPPQESTVHMNIRDDIQEIENVVNNHNFTRCFITSIFLIVVFGVLLKM